MLHIALHFAVPLLVAVALARTRWRRTWLVLIATMVVDVDHLLADPIYDPARCSIGFHPLHTAPVIVLYAVLVAAGLVVARRAERPRLRRAGRLAWLIGLGLLIHMALDAADCLG